MKFGGSSIESAERLRHAASLVCSTPPLHPPVVVLSAMGKTTNRLLQAGEEATLHGASKSAAFAELEAIRRLHLT
eukprot:SM011417S24025  [mRNA]  locus=s11417:46:386:+ [translate_table: standard]